jgi:hypothetical protein
MRTQQLKELFDFVEIKYEELLHHTKTRWLTLFPAIEKILKMYPALKGYFLLQPTRSVPTVIQKFFEDELSECICSFFTLICSYFMFRISELEKENNFAIEVIQVVDSVSLSLKNRLEEEFLPLKVKQRLQTLVENGSEQKCLHFKEETVAFYQTCLDYLKKSSSPLEELKCLNG